MLTSEHIKTAEITLPSGAILKMFVNTNTNLVCLDLNDGEKKGGYEIFRRLIDEKAMLSHLGDPGEENDETMKKDPCVLTESGTLESYHLKAGLKFPVGMKSL